MSAMPVDNENDTRADDTQDVHDATVMDTPPVVVRRHAGFAALIGAAAPRADGVPEPVDRLLAEVALAWAAHDLAGFAEGRSPSTWSGTVRFDPQLTAVETRTWLRHSACGCTWG